MSYNKSSFFGNIPPVVLNLMIINLLFWVASQVLPTSFGIDLVKLLGLHYWFSDKFNPIQLVTYMFLHDTSSISHLFCNMFGVWMFGRTLEQVWGAKKFLFFYLFTGVEAGIIQELTWMIDLHGITTAMNIAIAENSGEALVPFSSMFTGGNIANATAMDVIRLKQQIFAAHVTVGASELYLVYC